MVTVGVAACPSGSLTPVTNLTSTQALHLTLPVTVSQALTQPEPQTYTLTCPSGSNASYALTCPCLNTTNASSLTLPSALPTVTANARLIPDGPSDFRLTCLQNPATETVTVACPTVATVSQCVAWSDEDLAWSPGNPNPNPNPNAEDDPKEANPKPLGWP